MSFLLFPFIGFWSLLFSSFGKSRTSGTVQSAVWPGPSRRPASPYLTAAAQPLLNRAQTLGAQAARKADELRTAA